MRFALICLLLSALNLQAGMTVEVKLAEGVAPKPAVGGRVIVAFGTGTEMPNFTDVGPPGTPIFGTTVEKLTPEDTVTLNGKTLGFPMDYNLDKLPPGKYQVQALFMVNRDINLPLAPGNIISEVKQVTWDGKGDRSISLQLTRALAETALKNTKTHEYHNIPSPKLSSFYGRPMFNRVGVSLPKGFDPAGAEKPYGLVVHIGGFGQRYTSARGIAPDERFVQIQLDGAGPLGDPYYVDSANHGPYGAALIEEIIPFIEAKYRCQGTAKSRFTTGASTGGWVSLALQIFYPDVFNGCWSQCPDGVDFRAYELINIYSDKNVYINKYGFERPAKRTVDGETVYHTRFEVLQERVLGGGKWEVSGQQWASWNAVYGPKGKDGNPVPLWDGETGAIDKSVLESWKKYDLRMVLENDWKNLGPKLGGKIHIWVGDGDDYFLNNGVHLMKASLAKVTEPKFDGVIEIAPRMGHTNGWRSKRVLDEMAARMK
jgi:hypothetical protein